MFSYLVQYMDLTAHLVGNCKYCFGIFSYLIKIIPLTVVIMVFESVSLLFRNGEFMATTL